MPNRATPEQRNERLRSFIIVTREMIDNDDFENIHIRKIAEKAGFHNSTLYSYFKDYEYLISLASVKILEEYHLSLAKLSTMNLSKQEIFFEIWNFFSLNAFKFPEIFNNFFFGKHSNDLTSIFEKYYSIFPEEKQTFFTDIHSTCIGKNLNAIFYKILEPLTELKNNRVNKNNLTLVNDLIISSFKSFLDRALTHKSTNKRENATELTEQFMETLKFIIEQ